MKTKNLLLIGAAAGIAYLLWKRKQQSNNEETTQYVSFDAIAQLYNSNPARRPKIGVLIETDGSYKAVVSSGKTIETYDITKETYDRLVASGMITENEKPEITKDNFITGRKKRR